MTLYELLCSVDCDFDVYDTTFSIPVTMCSICPEDVEDSYDKFCAELAKHVTVAGKVQGCIAKANWSDLILKNYTAFKEFTAQYWVRDYENEDTFVYEWIKELHQYVAGNVWEGFYDVLLPFLTKLEAV